VRQKHFGPFVRICLCLRKFFNVHNNFFLVLTDGPNARDDIRSMHRISVQSREDVNA
jgi:hypothetical protein